MSPVAEATALRDVAPSRRVPWDINTRAVSAWVLSLALVLYLAIDGGGYALATHSQVGIAVWWVVVVAAAWGLLPAARLTRSAKWTVGCFAAFTAWTALGITWSISSGRSFQDLALVTCYLGILVLGVAIHRERGEALRHTTAAVATAIVVVAALALASRLWPHLFPASQQTAQFLGGARQRLSWPLNYWNALAALMAVGVPLLLAQATSARTLRMQALATASIPIVALCDALTLSRGGVIEGVAAVIVFIALAPERIPKLATAAVAAAGSAVVVYGGLHRHAIQQGLSNAAEHRQATSLLIATLLTCVGVGVMQLGIGLLSRHATLPRFLTVSRARARILSAAAIVVLVAAGRCCWSSTPSAARLDRLQEPAQLDLCHLDQPLRIEQRGGPLPVLGRRGELRHSRTFSSAQVRAPSSLTGCRARRFRATSRTLTRSMSRPTRNSG